jgi:hypothetical protein
MFPDSRHVVRVTEIRNEEETLPENFKEINPLRDRGLGGRIIENVNLFQKERI